VIKLYGTDACTSCRQAKMILERNNIAYIWVDVSKKPGFEGNIPQLQINDTRIFGLGEISEYIKNIMVR